MAEAAVCMVISNLVQLLDGEAKLSSGVHKDVETIKDELESIQCFLKNADEKAEMNEGAKIWVKQVRRVANQIEDVVDEYMLHLAKQPQENGFIDFFCKATRFIIKVRPRHQMAYRIQDIKISILEIRQRVDRYGFSSIEQDNKWLDPRVASLFIDDDEVVGIESPRDELISRLVREDLNESKRAVISLVGMGGLGKTTLAKKVYDNKIVIGHFDCRAWISVSQSYKTEDLLKKMINQFRESRKERLLENINTMEEASLVTNLREYLQDQRYVVFLDDVWNIDFWQYIRSSLPNNNKGSKIIITTRMEDVALSCLESPLDHVHRVQPLPQEKAWALFCKKTFQYDFSGLCPPELENCSLDILKKCNGLPLAIVAIGGLLSTKNKVLSEWKMFYKSLGLELGCNSHLTNISRIVLYSYHNLPYYLKPCFLYMGTIPEDYSIDCPRLIRLWIAEGFVKEQSGKSLEEIGKEYIIDLIHRNLMQASSFFVDGTAMSCCIHDLVREIIILKSRELSFCQVLTKENTRFDVETRRLAIHDGVDYTGETFTNSQIRSLLLFRADVKLSVSSLQKLIACFKFLKVLDLNDASIDELPEEVGNLLHLRYLSAKNTKIKIIPKSISNLRNLQTLDLTNSLVHELPIKLNRLQKMRHLFCYSTEQELKFHSIRGMKIQERIGVLKELQSLFFLEANHNGVDHVRELENLTHLRILGIANLWTDSGRAICTSIGKMEHIEKLDVRSTSEHEILDLQSLSSPPQSLRSLALRGRLEKLPDWIPKLQNLTTLDLFWSRLEDDPIQALQALPNLLSLTLYFGYIGEQMYFEAHGFHKLKKLRLRELNGLNLLKIEEGALPHLEDLLIGPCPKVKEVPTGIHYLSTLTTLEFVDMPEELLDRVEPNKGKQDHWIIKHIPLVRLWFKGKGGKYTVYKLGEMRK